MCWFIGKKKLEVKNKKNKKSEGKKRIKINNVVK